MVHGLAQAAAGAWRGGGGAPAAQHRGARSCWMPCMPRSPLLRAALAAALVLLALVPASAAAKRKVPPGWMGVNFDSAIASAPADSQAAQFPRMAAGGVEPVPASFLWAHGQPTKSGPLRFDETDRIVTLAARRRIRVLPIFIVAPEWARRYPDRPMSPAKNAKS